MSDLPAGLAKPARRALAEAGISRLEQLTEISETELSKLHGMGPKALLTINGAMNDRGLSFAATDESGALIQQADQQIKRRIPRTKP